VAVVQLDQALRDRETEAEAAFGALQRLLALHEALEHARQQLRLDADAFVGDGQVRLIPVGGAARPRSVFDARELSPRSSAGC
jgi:hypothetical protein